MPHYCYLRDSSTVTMLTGESWPGDKLSCCRVVKTLGWKKVDIIINLMLVCQSRSRKHKVQFRDNYHLHQAHKWEKHSTMWVEQSVISLWPNFLDSPVRLVQELHHVVPLADHVNVMVYALCGLWPETPQTTAQKNDPQWKDRELIYEKLRRFHVERKS